MSFSKAKLKRFNDVTTNCNSPATTLLKNNSTQMVGEGNATATTSVAGNSTSTSNVERKEQIEKFFKEAVRFGSNNKETTVKEDKKSKGGLRLFRTPSLPHRLRFRQHHDNNIPSSSTPASSATNSAATTPVKESSKSASKILKTKEGLQHELRKKHELINSYLSQIDVLTRHVGQLKEAEAKLREEHNNYVATSETMVQALQIENSAHKKANDELSSENSNLLVSVKKLESELCLLKEAHTIEIKSLNEVTEQLRIRNACLEKEYESQIESQKALELRIKDLENDVTRAQEKRAADDEQALKHFDLIADLRNSNESLIVDIKQLKQQIEQDTLTYAQETKVIQNEVECLKNERNTLKNDLATKCELIRSLQDELLDKNCEIDALCDNIRQLCVEKAQLLEKEKLISTAEQKVKHVELQAEQKVQKLESDLENVLEREKSYWRGELERRQKLAENEIIKIELEKQDVMVLLETTNDMLRERDEKIQKCEEQMQKYEEQLRNGVDYYVQLTDSLQKQVVTLKQEIAKTITEKYNYQLTLSNTRSTVNILMERLKKSDSDVEQLKADLEAIQLAKVAVEQSYISELNKLKSENNEMTNILHALRQTSQSLQNEVSIKETLMNEILTSEEATLEKFTKIQERIETDASRYADMYNELKSKDESRELYIQDMKKALDEFAEVLLIAQLELDNKEKALTKVQEDYDQLKLENIALRSKLDGCITPSKKKENITDFEKIEDLLIDSELKAECDKITSWLLSTSANEKSIRNESSNEINELLLKSNTPNKSKNCCTTPVRSSGGNRLATSNTTPRTPKTPGTQKTATPKKTVLFPGKENVCSPSPQKLVLKPRNV